MKAVIITIGDEILIGQTVDTNSNWIGARLNEIGIPVVEMITISDEKLHIIDALERAMKMAKLVIITGGLGPTNDDITKEVLTDFFDDELVLNEEIVKRIQNYFRSYNRPMLDVHTKQAMLPKHARILKNDLGTASGMWFKQGEHHVISLPGVPYEMKGLMEKITASLINEFDLEKIYHRTVLFQGIGESTIADEISDFERESRAMGIKVAYLPSVGIVRIRLTGSTNLKAEIDSRIQRLADLFPKHAFGFENDSLSSVIGKLLREKKCTLGTIESCTGGSLAEHITAVPGASDYFVGSIISYDNRIKRDLAGVSEYDLDNFGAVSQQVVESMAKNGRLKLGTDYTIATSGIAGPTGGTPEKPVGTVWIGIDCNKGTFSKVFHFKHNRERNIESTVVFALNFLRRIILGLES